MKGIATQSRGFTLVELLVVIVVMSVLVVITYTGVNAVIKDSKKDEVQTALTGARQKIEEYRKKEGGYPQLGQLPAGTIPANYTGNYFYASSYSWCAQGTCYCLEIADLVGMWPSQQYVNYHVSSINNDPLPGSCNGFQQEALGNGLGGQTVSGSSQYGSIEVESKTPLKGTFQLVATPRPPGYVSTALIRVAVYLDGVYTNSMQTTQYGNYNGTGTATWTIGAVDYGNAEIEVKVEWQHPTNGWEELVPVTVP